MPSIAAVYARAYRGGTYVPPNGSVFPTAVRAGFTPAHGVCSVVSPGHGAYAGIMVLLKAAAGLPAGPHVPPRSFVAFLARLGFSGFSGFSGFGFPGFSGFFVFFAFGGAAFVACAGAGVTAANLGEGEFLGEEPLDPLAPTALTTTGGTSTALEGLGRRKKKRDLLGSLAVSGPAGAGAGAGAGDGAGDLLNGDARRLGMSACADALPLSLHSPPPANGSVVVGAGASAVVISEIPSCF